MRKLGTSKNESVHNSQINPLSHRLNRTNKTSKLYFFLKSKFYKIFVNIQRIFNEI